MTSVSFWNKADWERIEEILVRFWDITRFWTEKERDIALHGCSHIYETKDGGLNSVQNSS